MPTIVISENSGAAVTGGSTSITLADRDAILIRY